MQKQIKSFIIPIFLFFCLYGCAKAEDIRVNAAEFTLTDLNNQTVSLSSYKDKQAVLLFFWTTWCPYCRVELKSLNVKYQDLTKKGLEILAVDIGEDHYRLESFVRRNSLTLKILLDEDGRVAESYEVLGVPAFVIIDKNGNIVFSGNYFPESEYKQLISKNSKI